MSGALVDLVAKGVQDAYLTGKPEVSFFRQKYARHTNFAMKPVKLTPMGKVAANSEVSIKIPNKGDLLSYVWLELNDYMLGGTGIPGGGFGINADTSNPAVFELYIGGQLVDRQDATFMVLHWQKFLCDSGAKAMSIITSDENDSSIRGDLLNSQFLPLHFFFCDSYPLPLVSLAYHEVEIKIKFSSGDPGNIGFYANYIMLDTNERDWFVNTDHSILIEQVQRLPATNGTDSNPTFDLSLLNHPVKSLHWSNVLASNFNTGEVMIYLNGTQLFDDHMTDRFFTHVQGYYHSEHASELLKGTSSGGQQLKMYSFAQKVSKHVPTGSCNFSRLDNAEMKLTGVSPPGKNDIYLYAVNWNVLRIKQGMAGLAFSN
jgi:hypothetical protein